MENDKRKRAIWPWLLMIIITVTAIGIYTSLMQTWNDLQRLWSDLVQLFWLLVPDQQQ